MSGTLPKGWVSANICEISNIVYGKGLATRNISSEGQYPVFGANAVIGFYNSYLYEKPQVLISCRGAKSGTINISPEKCHVTSNSLVLELPDIIYKEHRFILYSLESVDKSKIVTGTAQPQVTIDNLKDFTIPLPPLKEQKRIVARLDQIMPRIDAVKERLDKVSVIVKRFRQSVLTAAVTGKLTEQWRAEHPYVESVGDIATKISKTIKIKNNESIIIDDEDYPNEWLPTYFVNILSELKNGISPRPNISPPGTNILRISANRSGYVKLDDVRYLPNGNVRYAEWLLKEKDLLFTRYNGNIDLVGVCGQVKNIEGQILYPDKLMRVRLKDGISIPGYIEIVFQSKKLRDYVISKAKSSAGQNGLSGKDLKKAVVPIPSLEEQKEIVRQVDKLFALADRLESHYQKAKARVDKLSQSVLAKAFRGELVITEAELAEKEGRDFETAEKLLERIMEEKAKLVGSRQSAGGRKTVKRKETGRKKK